jgi:hypothetical protein
MGDSAGVHVHHAADGAGAVQQGAGSFENLDAVGDERLDGHGVIRAGYRDVERVDAVFQDPHPRSRQPMNDRSAGRLAEVGGVNAGLVAHRLADAAFDFSGELATFQYLAGQRQTFGRKGMGSNDDLLDGSVCGRAAGLLGAMGCASNGATQRRCN